ncbi:extracellular electron transfer flavoprotein PplA [Vagococcus intermedius]|uniref:FMN-binding protein n=1 Tax=Vagococcus intermedius TaxID=2991418 RepID=A0AAF0I7W3_9ENTE|nr:extracellular electron transfer flavoprotein PplA [Vagococcus intermedius]WEG73351.1 FMN-binding protein [Vagococcus intermedius]WEG75431.1 FMN-binding protein [Vagococcus intermedius]
MKKTKFLTGFAVLAMSSLLLVACAPDNKTDDKAADTKTEETVKSSDKKEEAKDEEKAPAKKVAGGDLKDGTYKLEEKNENNGYRATFEMTVKDGKITDSKYDNINKDGKSKTEDKEYNKMMTEKSGVGPETFIPELNEAFLAAQDASGVEVVTGATHSTGSFKNYAQQLIQAAQAGNTDTIEIDNGADLKDGEYTLEEKNDSNGYHTVFTMVVKDKKIAESNYDNLNKDGKSKQKDADYNKMMKEQAGTSPETFIPELNKALEEKGAPAEVEVVTGATHSTHSFQMYAEQLVNAAEKGATDKIVVDNIVTE